MDPKQTGYITDHHLFAEASLDCLTLSVAMGCACWAHTQDGNGQVNWPEFVEWAEANNVELELGHASSLCHRQYSITDSNQFVELDELLQKTYKKVYTRDRKKTGIDKVPAGYELVKAFTYMWVPAHYTDCNTPGGFSSTEPAQKPQNRSSRDVHLAMCFGTFGSGAAKCTTALQNFRSRALQATGTLYGRGTYFAESITKADEYAKPDDDGLCCVLVCRIAAGTVLYNDEARFAESGHALKLTVLQAQVTPDADKLQSSCISGEYHSILGDREKCRNTFKEFVIFDADQVYVEYALFYKRRYT
ncbi:unnamed protein product [Symbiodinium natans]|uniref:PARP catalytic domain-containing protein n=1 Tax=Symbiodinium natans TaxID=878477 RepID=A0A812IBC0_9DINO|nr:unnamed protein product [Symbiodinium natans]